jgi:signal transduction histidine kinase
MNHLERILLGTGVTVLSAERPEWWAELGLAAEPILPATLPDGRTMCAAHAEGHLWVLVSGPSGSRWQSEALQENNIGLWRYDIASQRVEWTPQMHFLTGCEIPMTPAQWLEHVHPEDRPLVHDGFRNTLALAEFRSVPHRFIRPDRSEVWLMTFGTVMRDESGRANQLIGATVDASSYRAQEHKLQSARRLEALGQMTAGVTHNLNNLLAVILPVLDLVRSRVAGEVLEAVDEARQAGQRATELLRTMTGFGRLDRQHPATEHFDTLVRRVVSLVARAFESSIDVRVTAGAGSSSVRGNLAQLEQAVMNILLNARDAVRDAKRSFPRIDVSTSIRSSAAVAGLDAISTQWLCVSIRDNGTGIPRAIQEQLFQPFFTTKNHGEGTGLGLATVLSTVQHHRGSVQFHSEEGEGTTFEIFLPVDGDHQNAPGVSSRRRSVLVVDDEMAVRRSLGRLLELEGFRVFEAADGETAVSTLRANLDIATVLLDRTMPGLSGAQTVPLLRAAAPHVRIVFHTGQDVAQDEARLVDAILRKPARTTDLLNALA